MNWQVVVVGVRLGVSARKFWCSADILTSLELNFAGHSSLAALPYLAQSAHQNKGLHQHREPHSWRNIIKPSWAFSMMSPLYHGTVNQESSPAQLIIFIPVPGISTTNGFEYDEAGSG